MIKELEYTQLRHFFESDKVNFQLSDEKYNEIVGQYTGAEALKFGLGVKRKGYNIYVSGMSGSGKTTFAEKFALDRAKNEPVPDDLCYVYNFDDAKEPKLLRFKAGGGKAFAEEMEELIQVLSIEIPKAFSTDEYDAEKDRIMKSHQEERDEILKELTAYAKENGFSLRMNNGVYFLPVVDGKALSDDEFDELDDEEREDITKRSGIIQDKVGKVMRTVKSIDKKTKTELSDMDYNIALLTVGRFFNNILEKYVDNAAVIDYLTKVKEDILDNISDFLGSDDNNEEEIIMPWLMRKNNEDNLLKYQVNVLVDNSKLEHAPVVVTYNPSYTNLVGEVEFDTENGNFITDFTKIKGGLIHQANGGYLIIQVTELLSVPFAWETLRRALKTQKITIEPMKEYQTGVVAVTTIKPEAVDIDLKVILVGTNYYYSLLNEYDDDFGKLFKICAMFDYEMDCSDENISAMVRFVKEFVKNNNALPVDDTALCLLMEYSTRLAENQEMLSARFSLINEILFEADAWARLDNKESVTREYIRKAIDKKLDRVNLYKTKYTDMILKDQIIIETTGKKVGQINGLCVVDMGQYSFGLPTKITASTYMGKAGIVNIEKEAEMSGSIHDKGVQVLIGYLGSKYAQKCPLSLSCRICFEQNYNGVDGDSASSTEVYSIISSLADMPVNQELAVTGSINQKGEIQPIGGVTYKIEGFFDICAQRGLTGNQGVIIPKQNVKDLTLKDEVVNAVKDGKFHIYAIESIDDGLELLLGCKAGTISDKGTYPRGSIHYKAMKKLKSYYDFYKEES